MSLHIQKTNLFLEVCVSWRCGRNNKFAKRGEEFISFLHLVFDCVPRDGVRKSLALRACVFAIKVLGTTIDIDPLLWLARATMSGDMWSAPAQFENVSSNVFELVPGLWQRELSS
ncbi:hypothetical protein BO221_32680 [Archangium sp. Cb G35]|nr:hypothetical protein BO221_32680 [Archangium sp. Cb G35]